MSAVIADPGTAVHVEEIPILDLGPYLAGETGARGRLGTELRHALEDRLLFRPQSRRAA